MAVQPQWQAQSTTRHLIPALENKEQRATFPPHAWEEISTGTARVYPRVSWLPAVHAEGLLALGLGRGAQSSWRVSAQTLCSLCGRRRLPSPGRHTFSSLRLQPRTGIACPRAGAGSFPSIALPLPTAWLPRGSALPLRLPARLCLTGSVPPLASQRHLPSFPPPLHSDFPRV